MYNNFICKYNENNLESYFCKPSELDFINLYHIGKIKFKDLGENIQKLISLKKSYVDYHKGINRELIDIDIPNEVHIYWKGILPPDNTINLNNHNTPSIPIMKSNLQKSIRRNRPDIAFRTASSLTSTLIGFKELLRRISIIMVEDSIIHVSITSIVWLMCAIDKKPNIFYDIFFKKWIVSVCVLLSKLNRKHLTEKFNINEYNNIRRTLLIRSRYGGMHGDMAMLLGVKPEKYSKKKIKIINEFKFLKNNSILPSSIDFHVYPDILVKISEKYAYSPELIKKIIWKCSSATNKRKNHPHNYRIEKKEMTIWSEIKKYKNNLSLEFLNR